MSEKENFFRCYATSLKDSIYTVIDIAVTNLNAYPNIYYPWKNLSLERGSNNEFNHLIITIKLPSRQIRDSWYLEAFTERPIGILSFFVRITEKYLWKRSVLDNVEGYRPAVLLKQKFFLRDFSSILSIDSADRIITEQLVWRRPFQSEYLQWLLLFMPSKRSKHIKSIHWVYYKWRI